MTALRTPARIDIWHNIVWSKYKGAVFSALYEIIDKERFDCRFFQIAETEGNRVGLSGVDLSHHRYPYDLLFKGSYDNINLTTKVLTVLNRTRRSNADFTLLAGYHKFEYWIQLMYLKMEGKKVAVFCDSTMYDNPQSRLRGLLKRLFFRSVDGIFCYGDRSREYVIHHGANPDYVFKRCQAAALPPDYSLQQVFDRRQLQAPSPEKPRYLYVGRLAAEKDLHTLLKAFSLVISRIPGATLALVGSGPQREALEAQAQSLGLSQAVVFAGSKSSEALAEEYLCATCLILPSTSEPWGLVVNEALAYGCPAIASDRCGCAPELVVDGKTGFCHVAADANDLAQKMIAAPSQFSNIAVTARDCQEWISSYSPKAAATQILKGIETIIGRGGESHE